MPLCSAVWLVCENFSWKFPCYWNNLALLAFCSPGSELWSLAPVTWPAPGCWSSSHIAQAAWPGSAPANVPIKKKHQTSLRFSLWKSHVNTLQVSVNVTHKSCLPFLFVTLVFFVFYWHSVKILRKNGKVAEPVRGEQAGPGGARRSACVPVTCCLCRPRTGPAARARVSPPSCPAPAWTALGPRHVGLARACQGNCTKSKKERDDEYSWVLCKHVSWHLVWGKYIIPKLCFLRQSKYFTFVILKRILRNYLHNLICFLHHYVLN